MKLKKLTQKLFLIAGTACLAMLAFVSPASSLSAQAASGSSIGTTIQPQSDDIQYRYKIENGKMYKRLYNYSIGVWIGNWIYVCDYPR